MYGSTTSEIQSVIDLVASGKLNLSDSITERFPLEEVNPVRNSSGALNPAGIILTSNPAAAASPASGSEEPLAQREGLRPGGSSGALFLTG
ncbi:MAG: hypothetical protein COZ69_10425 [Deltaproteobacteria bacterium CG_4_8_14_3_um_filter_45_9]|nr:MAG: hypothetical protein COZ69_10425 [Deltaproteobacteria bacterium CG_4_8_14_3_um_filter_45_9]